MEDDLKISGNKVHSHSNILISTLVEIKTIGNGNVKLSNWKLTNYLEIRRAYLAAILALL